jgi:Na+-translocating ferredoxin:NAD+ oxidoreductase RnfG subunit
MRWEPLLTAPLVVIAAPAWASVYLTVEQAQQAIFAGEALRKVPFVLTPAQRDTLRERTGVHEPFNEDGVWQTVSGGFFIVDRVVGKHELITYAVGINRDGTVRQIEIMEYRETYGSEVRNPAWRKQFVGKSAASPVKLNQDIANITGATLSSKHVTDGVRRVLAVYDVALKDLPGAGR